MDSGYTPVKRRTFAPLTEIRAYRLSFPFTLVSVAQKAGIPFVRASIAERDPDGARPEDVAALRRAIAELAAERERGIK
jgi:hypothetical protein